MCVAMFLLLLSCMVVARATTLILIPLLSLVLARFRFVLQLLVKLVTVVGVSLRVRNTDMKVHEERRERAGVLELGLGGCLCQNHLGLFHWSVHGLRGLTLDADHGSIRGLLYFI